MAYIRDLERDLIFDYGINEYKSATHDISKISDGVNLYSIKDNYAYHEGELANVATTGSYNDLVNKPTIPTVDQTYNATSSNAQSGVAIEGMMTAKFQVVDALPQNPVNGVFYFIKE